MASSISSSGWRRSTVKNTSPGMTLGEFGFTSNRPTVATASGACAIAIPCTSPTMRDAHSSASLRRASIGVVPAWEFAPVTTISYQRMPCTPVTTPMSCAPLRGSAPARYAARRRRTAARCRTAPSRDSRSPRGHRRTRRRRGRSACRRPVAREHAGEHARGDHRRVEARALLVGPVDHLDRREGLVPGGVQRAQRLQRGQHPERSVELAAGRLGIEVAAHRDRRNADALALPAREHRAHVVHRHGAADLLAARLEPVAHLAVEVGQGEPADAALGGPADRAGLHQVVPQPLGIDAAGCSWRQPAWRWSMPNTVAANCG